jgi:hypothetical protein
MHASRPRPTKDRRWGRLEPVAGAWLDLAPPDAPDGVRILYALLDSGMLEAWGDGAGHVRLRGPT